MTLKKFGKFLATLAVAATGIGLLYLWARTKTVSPGAKGIVTNYLTGKNESLEPGTHLILSPFCSFVKEVPFECDIQKQLKSFEVKSSDQVDALIQASFILRVTDPILVTTKVKEYEFAVEEQVRGTISSILQERAYKDIKTGSLELDESVSPNIETKSNAEASENKLSTAQRSASIASKYWEKLKQTLASWGIIASHFRIISVEPKGKKVMEEMEETALIETKARARLQAATLQAQAIQILADSEVQANAKRGKAATEIAKELKTDPQALKIYQMNLQLEATKSLVNGNVISLGGSTGASVIPALLRNSGLYRQAQEDDSRITINQPSESLRL